MDILAATRKLQDMENDCLRILIEVEAQTKINNQDKERIVDPLFMARVELGSAVSSLIKWGRHAHERVALVCGD